MGISRDPSLNFALIEITLLISGRAETGLLAGSVPVKINVLSFSKISRVKRFSGPQHFLWRTLWKVDQHWQNYWVYFSFIKENKLTDREGDLYPGISPSVVHS